MYEERERESSSEDFDIVLEDEAGTAVERVDALESYGIDADTLADKPWRRPGEDITDYFNYGFNETTWKEYIAKQKRMREDQTQHQRRRRWGDG